MRHLSPHAGRAGVVVVRVHEPDCGLAASTWRLGDAAAADLIWQTLDDGNSSRARWAHFGHLKVEVVVLFLLSFLNGILADRPRHIAHTHKEDHETSTANEYRTNHDRDGEGIP